jgi:two-component system, NtrC family, response regulator AtoC
MTAATARAQIADSPIVAGVPEHILFGHGAPMRAVRATVDKVASTNVPVLIVGESGTGKEVVARFIHSRSLLSAGPFVRINCPGIPGSLLESELFGYEKGAFTGATISKAGLVEAATEGTLFLDGIGELELSLQSKFLQFLQDSQFTRIGGQETLRADVRIMCAASRPLEAEIAAGNFRGDLFYRINVVAIELPPLRDRRADIPELIDFFLDDFATQFGRHLRPIRKSTRDLLVKHDWPGNIRQLENIIKRYVILESEDTILSDLCASAPLGLNSSPSATEHLSLTQLTRRATRELERRIILDTLAAHRWNRRKAAQALRISYRALLYKMKEGGLPTKKPSHAAAAEEDQD